MATWWTQFRLALLIDAGLLGPKDMAKVPLPYRTHVHPLTAHMPHSCALSGRLAHGHTVRHAMQAFKLYAAAAKSAHVGALFNTGVCYELGEGVACDMQAAAKMSSPPLAFSRRPRIVASRSAVAHDLPAAAPIHRLAFALCC